jgi:hypothetical protein
MEQYDEGLSCFAVDKIEIYKIAIWRIPSLATVSNFRFRYTFRGIDGLQMATGQPVWGWINHRCARPV